MSYYSSRGGYKPRSTTKEAKQIIRSEIEKYYGDKDFGRDMSTVQRMKIDADNYNAGEYPRKGYPLSDWRKGSGLVDAGSFACYYRDQAKMLNKIYGKDCVDQWEGEKIHQVYASLIGREYAAMLREEERKK